MRIFLGSMFITTAISASSVALYSLLFWTELERRLSSFSWQYLVLFLIIYPSIMTFLCSLKNILTTILTSLIISVISGSLSYIIVFIIFSNNHSSLMITALTSTIGPFFLFYTWAPGVIASVIFCMIQGLRGRLPPPFGGMMGPVD